jgi:hypothetical protein
VALMAPTVAPQITDEQWQQRQQTGSQKDGYNAGLTAQIQQLPSFQAWLQSLQRPGLHATGAGVGGTPEWHALKADIQARGIPVPENELLDSSTGTVRGKTWMERHPVLANVLVTAGFAGGGAALGAMAGGGAAAGAAGAASGGAGTAGTIAGGSAAAGGAGVGSAITGTYLPLAGTALSAIGQYQQGKANQQNSDRQYDLNLRTLQQQAENQRSQFNRQNPGIQMSNSTRGDILANAQPATASGTGRDLKISGGLGPQNFSDNTRQLGALTSRQALLAAMGQQDSKGNIGGIPNPYAPPRFDELEQLRLQGGR